MKVCIINAVCGSGSTGRIVRDSYEALTKEGCDVMIAYGLFDAIGVPFENTFKFNDKVGYYFHNLLAKITDKTGFFSKSPTGNLINFLDQFNPDVLWLHNLHGYYINIEMLFAWIKSRPQMQVKWTLHDCWAFTGHCTHFDFCGCEKWKTQCSNCPQTKEYPSSFLVDNSTKNYNRKRKAFTGVKKMEIITPSKWLAGLVKDSFLKEYPLSVIPNTIDTAVFKPTPSDFREKHGLENKTIVLGVANVWDARKGYQDFIKLRALLDDRFHIVMVGLTAKQIHELPQGTTGITRTYSATELAAIYTAADVFFNPTYEDTFPTVNMEAIACGAPVVTYNTGGSPEVIRQGVSGYIVKPGDLEAAKQALFKSVTHLNKENCCKQAVEFDKRLTYISCVKLLNDQYPI